MVHLSRIYTRGGDDGDTGLGDGSRRPKHDPRVAAYGEVDELGAVLGLCHLHAEGTLADRIRRIQNELFDCGADLCNPGDGGLRILAEQTARLEAEIDEINADLPELKSFVLAGGNALGAHLHLARCVARRAERQSTAAASAEPINAEVLRYLNRLSDWLFVMARHANGGDEVLWKPGG